jgi:hypothetical protein
MPPQPGRTVLCSVSPSGSARRARRAIRSLGHCGRLGLLGRRRLAERRVRAERSCPGNRRSTLANHELGASSPDRFTTTIRAPGDHPPPGLMSRCRRRRRSHRRSHSSATRHFLAETVPSASRLCFRWLRTTAMQEIFGEPNGSQRPQLRGYVRPQSADLSAARRHIRPHLPPSGDVTGVPPKQ